MVEAHYFMNTYIAGMSLIIYYHPWSTVWAWCYYCDIILSCYNIRYHGSTRVTFPTNNSTIWPHNSTTWHHNNTIWHHNSTIWHHKSSTMMRGQYWKILPGQYGILGQYAPLLKVMWPGIHQSALSIYVLTYNKE